MSLRVLRDFPSSDQLARDAADDLFEKITSLLSLDKEAHIVLTGGTVGIKTLYELAPLVARMDLSRLHLWWGDERFVESESPDRNFIQARDALLSKIPVQPKNLHPMPSVESGSLSAAASAFASELEAISPKFDIVLLGMGPDGHVASLFPGSTPEGHGELVIAESNSPKPPAERISLSYKALCSADEVWFLVAGSDKADAVSKVFEDKTLPAALVFGKKHTRWYVDAAAAEKLTF
jgi:6-phosphogluconolactonase